VSASVDVPGSDLEDPGGPRGEDDLDDVLKRLQYIVEATQLADVSIRAVSTAFLAIEGAQLALAATHLQLQLIEAPERTVGEVSDLILIFTECHDRLLDYLGTDGAS
jgi:hypothetical protein